MSLARLMFSAFWPLPLIDSGFRLLPRLGASHHRRRHVRDGGVEVVAQGRAGQRLPAVLPRQLGDALEQGIGVEPVVDRVVDVGDRRPARRAVRTICGDVEQAEALEQLGPAAGRSPPAGPQFCARFSSHPRTRAHVVTAQVVQQSAAHGIHQRLERGDDLGDRRTAVAMVEVPTHRPVQQAGGCPGGRCSRVPSGSDAGSSLSSSTSLSSS